MRVVEAAVAVSHFPPVGELVVNTRAVLPSTAVRVVADTFLHEPRLDAVAVVEHDRPIGLVTRAKFLFSVFRQFGWEIYQRRPIRELTDHEPLVIDERIELDQALRLALARPQADLYDEIVVTRRWQGCIVGRPDLDETTLSEEAVRRKMEQLRDRVGTCGARTARFGGKACELIDMAPVVRLTECGECAPDVVCDLAMLDEDGYPCSVPPVSMST